MPKYKVKVEFRAVEYVEIDAIDKKDAQDLAEQETWSQCNNNLTCYSSEAEEIRD